MTMTMTVHSITSTLTVTSDIDRQHHRHSSVIHRSQLSHVWLYQTTLAVSVVMLESVLDGCVKRSVLYAGKTTLNVRENVRNTAENVKSHVFRF